MEDLQRIQEMIADALKASAGSIADSYANSGVRATLESLATSVDTFAQVSDGLAMMQTGGVARDSAKLRECVVRLRALASEVTLTGEEVLKCVQLRSAEL